MGKGRGGRGWEGRGKEERKGGKGKGEGLCSSKNSLKYALALSDIFGGVDCSSGRPLMSVGEDY